MLSWSRLLYYWQRRKVVRRGLRNWAELAFREPFRRRGSPGEPAVVFVCLNARARQFNHGWLLRRGGVRTILLSSIFDYGFQREAFDEVHLFCGFEHLQKTVARLGRRYRLLAVIGSTQPSRQTRALLDMQRSWPVLVDPYDSLWALCHFAGLKPGELSAVSTWHSTEEVAGEEDCFRRADAVIARLGYLPELFREAGVQTPTLLLEDGCNPRFFQPLVPRTGPRREEWSVVYAGIFYPLSRDARLCGDAHLVGLGRLFEAEGIHFHLYPGPHHDYQYPEYKAEAARNRYFHLHPAVGFSRVQAEISRYDFGWLANDYSRTIQYSPTLGKHTLPLKLFTYLEAGLPLITTGLSEPSERIAGRTGAGVVVGTEAPRGLRAVIEKQDLPSLLRGVERARSELDLTPRGAGLLAFIQEARSRYDRRRRAARSHPAPAAVAS